LAGFCQLVEKTGFPMEKNWGGKIVFAGKVVASKNSFCHINCEAICQNQAYVRKKKK